MVDNKKQHLEDYTMLRIWMRESAYFIAEVSLFIAAITLAPADVINQHFTTENFKNAIYFLMVLVVCIKEYKTQKSSENMWRLIFMITGFYFGISVTDTMIQ